MAGTIGRKFIEKFVLKKLAEKSGKRTGITTIQNVKDPQVQFNIEEVRKTIESLGMSPNDVKSVAEIEKIMNIRKAISDQTLKNKFKNLGLDKGVDDLAKKPPFQGFTPTIVGKPPKGNINYTAMEEKFGFPLRGNESLSELAKIEKIGRDQYYNMLASRAMNIRRRMSKVDAEGGTEIGYEEFNKLQEELDGLNDFITRVQKEIPEDMASGGLARVGYADGSYKSEGLFGISMEDIRKYKEKEIMDRTPPFAIPDDWLEKFLKRFEKTGTYEQPMASGGVARVGYAGGKIVKGAPWVINKLKEQLFDMDLGIGGSTFSKLTSTQKDFYKKELNTLIKQLEQGGEIPKEMLDTMIADPKFKSVVKTRSTDKDLYDLEDALLDHQAGKQADQIVDDVFGPFDADGKLNKKRQMTADELEDFEMDIGDALEGYDFDGTVGSAEKILKEQKSYERYMYNQYKAGRLDPKPGEPNRKRFLEKKLEEMEMSGDKKLMTREEIEELESFNLEDEMFDAEGKLNKKAVLQEVKDSEEKMLLDKFDVTGRKKNASGGRAGRGLNYLLGEDDQNVRTPYQGGIPGLLGE